MVNKEKESSIYSAFPTLIVQLSNKLVVEGKYLFLNVSQLTNEREIIELGDHYFVIPSKWVELETEFGDRQNSSMAPMLSDSSITPVTSFPFLPY